MFFRGFGFLLESSRLAFFSFQAKQNDEKAAAAALWVELAGCRISREMTCLHSGWNGWVMNWAAARSKAHIIKARNKEPDTSVGLLDSPVETPHTFFMKIIFHIWTGFLYDIVLFFQHLWNIIGLILYIMSIMKANFNFWKNNLP